jgi:putative chitinase
VITREELLRIMPNCKSRVDAYVEPLNDAMREFEIDTPLRQAAFLAQIAHESGEFRYVREIASGSAYEGRRDLGNTEPGDGVRFKGRGLIQITGRRNYRDCSEALFANPQFLLDHPEALEQPVPACRSAAWFWNERFLNELADKADFKLITKRINGGFNGYADRMAYYQRAQEVFA